MGVAAARFFEEALQNFIHNLSGLQTYVPIVKTPGGTTAGSGGSTAACGIPVRVMKLNQGDSLPAIIIGPDKETQQNDLSYTAGAVEWNGKIRCVGSTFADVRLMMELIRTNGTNPGTGLAGFSGYMDGWNVQGARIGELDFDFIFFDDGTDNGDFVIDADVGVEFAEST